MNVRKQFTIVGVALAIMFAVVFSGKIMEVNDKTTYQIKQSILGDISCRTKPGPYFQGFGNIDTWDKAYSLFYTEDKDVDDDVDEDNSIRVLFNQGGGCNISATMRINMPSAPQQCINLVTVDNYPTFMDLEQKLLKPTVRKSMRNAASLISAIESSKERRSDYTAYVIDQLENGPYILTDEKRVVTDDVTGEKVRKTFKIIKKDKDGNKMYEKSPLDGSGITIKNFEVKKFRYDPKIQSQIGKQRDMKMSIQTEKAQSALEEQKSITIKATKEKEKIEAEWTEKTKTAKETEQENREKALAIIKASKKVALEEQAKLEALVKASKDMEVAEIDLKTALTQKQSKIAEGQGIAKYNELINKQGATPAMKLEAYVRVMEAQYKAFGVKASPTVLNVSGPSGGAGTTALDSQQSALMNAMNLSALKNLGIEMNVNATK